MISFKVAIIFIACLAWSLADKYCSLCKDHTMCKYKGVGSACKGGGSSGVTASQKKEIVDLHNNLRRLVATGRETRGAPGGQPKASNLRKLVSLKAVWDNDLAKVAQRWADQCQYGHDTCRKDPRWYVGQNIFWSSSTPKKPVNWTESIMFWYDEVAKFNPKNVDKYSFDMHTGHYTQVLWHETYAIGCGAREYGNQHLYVCNYGPGGNMIGTKVYNKGQPCSGCPGGTTCENSLCVRATISARTSVPPPNSNWYSNIITDDGGSSPTEVSAQYPLYENLDFEINNEMQNEISYIHDRLDTLLYSFIKNTFMQNRKSCEQPHDHSQ